MQTIQLFQWVLNWAYDHTKSESISLPLSSSVKGFPRVTLHWMRSLMKWNTSKCFHPSPDPQGPLGNQGKTHKGIEARKGTEQSPP